MTMKPSEVSAARFLALRAAKEKARIRLRLGRERAAAATRVADMKVEDHWRYIEAHVPDAVLSWVRDVGLPDEEFVFGIVGRPITAVAIDLGCYMPSYARCRCHSFRKGEWRPFCHPPIVNGSSKDCDVCDAPCGDCRVEGE